MQFYKLQGAGNDFIVFDGRSGQLSLEDIISLAPRLCHRRLGIGADGIMALFPPSSHGHAYTMIYRNADGSDAGMCGNGGRCIARLAVHLGVEPKHRFRVHNDVYEVEVLKNTVVLNMPATPSVSQIKHSSGLSLQRIQTGTDHVVLYVDKDTFTKDDTLINLGRSLRHDPLFAPAGTNVNFILNEPGDMLRIKTYERGVENLTLACGTGTLAAAIVHHHLSCIPHAKGDDKNTTLGAEKRGAEKSLYTTSGKTSSAGYNPAADIPSEIKIDVMNPGGILTTRFTPQPDNYTNLILEGPAEIVFEGTLRV